MNETLLVLAAVCRIGGKAGCVKGRSWSRSDRNPSVAAARAQQNAAQQRILESRAVFSRKSITRSSRTRSDNRSLSRPRFLNNFQSLVKADQTVCIRPTGISADSDVLSIRVHLASVEQEPIRRAADLDVGRARPIIFSDEHLHAPQTIDA